MGVGVRRSAIAAIAVAAAAFTLWRIGGYGPGAGPSSGDGTEEGAHPTEVTKSPDSAAGPGLAAATPRRGAAGAAETAPLPPPVDLDRCDRDLDLFGVVVTPQGKPVAGARLVTVTYPTRRGNLLDWETYDVAVEGPGTRSAEDGTFSIRLRRGDRVSLRVSAAGRAGSERPGCAAGQRLRVVLGSGVLLVVTLRDEAGRAVPSTPVRLFRPEHAGEASFTRRSESDAEGHATFDELPGGVWAYVDPKPTTLGSVMWRRVDLPAEGQASLEIVLPTGRTVTGRVTDAQTKAPIAGARVGINWVLDRAVTTDTDGRYSISGWNDQQGAQDLHVVAAGYGRQAVVVGAKETIDFVLERGDAIVGRAVDEQGRPVSGAIVGVVAIGEKAGSTGGDILGSVTTDAGGRFGLTGLLRDQNHALVVMARGFGRYLLDFAPREGGAGEIDLGDVTLPAARAIEGRVLDGSAAPVADVPVSLKGANADRGRLLGGGPANRNDRYGQTEEARTDDLGRFRFPDLSPGPYALTAAPDRGERVRRTVTLAAAEDLRDVDLVLEATREVVVHVRDAEGAPLAGAYVSASILNRRVGGSTGADGDTHLQLTAEAWTVQVHVPDSSSAAAPGAGPLLVPPPQPVPTTAKELTFVLERAQPITGAVRDPSGAPVEGAIVEAVQGERIVDTAKAGPDGAFRVLVPAGSRVDLRVTRRQTPHAAGNGAFMIALSDWTGGLPGVEAGATGVALQAQPSEKDATIVVRVLAPSGAAVDRAVVSALAPGVSTTETTSATGLATLRVPSRGSYEVVVVPSMADGALWCAERLAAVNPDGKPLTVRLREGTPLVGTVLDAGGKPAVETSVHAYLSGGRWVRSARTDAAGRFRIALDATLDYPLVVRADGRREGVDSEASLDLRTAPTADVELRLREVPR